jgi:thiol-disulfide isomerase/thioredoxin
MDRQKIVFWLLIILFGFSVTAYVTRVMTQRSAVVNFAQKVEDFRKIGVPDFTLPQLDTQTPDKPGPQFHFADVKSKVILLNFWASWCTPCQTEFPSLVNLSKKYASDTRLKIVAVSIDRDVPAAANFLGTGPQPAPSNFIALSDPDGRVAAEYGTKKIPETYIIGADHKLLSKVISEQNWTSTEFLALLNRLLSQHETEGAAK